jgi:hypothetical protein
MLPAVVLDFPSMQISGRSAVEKGGIAYRLAEKPTQFPI